MYLENYGQFGKQQNRVAAMSEDAELISFVVNNIGCMTARQAVKLLRNEAEHAEQTINFLMYRGHLTVAGKFIVPKVNAEIDQDRIDSLWVLINQATSDNGYIDLDVIHSAFINNPARISAVTDETCLNIMPLSEQNATTRLAYIKEKYAQSEQDTQSWDATTYVFVVRNRDVFEIIADANIPFNHKIAYLTGDMDEEPVIKYYGVK